MSLYTWLKNWWNNSPKPNNKYGWVKDKLDYRDQLFLSDVMPVQVIPEKIDLRPKFPPVYNQGNLGSCTANAIAGILEYQRMNQGLSDYMPSRLQIYYDERALEGTVNSDSGAMIRDGIKVVNQNGACDENIWPYIITRFTWKPSADAYANALQHQALKYQRVFGNRGELIRLSLSNGFPVVFGFTVFSSFETQIVTNTGIVPMPDTSKEQILGGHAVVIVGYLPVGQITPGKRHFIVRNSWGLNWGDHGYFYMPEDFITNPNYCEDFWSVQLVE